MNGTFHIVVTREKIVQPPGHESGKIMQEIQLTVQVKESLNKVDVRKEMGSDGVTRWIFKECSEQLVEKLHSIMSASLSEGKVQDWTRANIVPIFKGGKKEDLLSYRPLTNVVAKICKTD